MSVADPMGFGDAGGEIRAALVMNGDSGEVGPHVTSGDAVVASPWPDMQMRETRTCGGMYPVVFTGDAGSGLVKVRYRTPCDVIFHVRH